MFGILKKTSKIEKLQKRYVTLMKKWHQLSTTNRAESDKKYAEAQQIIQQTEQIKL